MLILYCCNDSYFESIIISAKINGNKQTQNPYGKTQEHLAIRILFVFDSLSELGDK